MNPQIQERLYKLLPALYHRVDELEGSPLRTLMAVLGDELTLLEEDISAQYDNWFIETGDRWIIPYMAALVGVEGLNDPQQLFDGQRRRVANTIGYRRRKGTISVVEDVIHDVTGWPTRAVEFFQLLAVTQHMAHVRADRGRLFDCRDVYARLTLDTPFNNSAHTADIRHIQACQPGQKRGLYNLTNIGLYLWRLQSYPVLRSPARHLKSTENGNNLSGSLYAFHPLGFDTPLFHLPAYDDTPTSGTPVDRLPVRLSNRLLSADLDAYAATFGHLPRDERPPNSVFYGPDRGLLISFWDYDTDAKDYFLRTIQPDEIVSRSSQEDASNNNQLNDAPEKLVALDVDNGRFQFLTALQPKSTVLVNYTYARSGDIGGGPYERDEPHSLANPNVLQIRVAEGIYDETFKDDVKKRWQNTERWFAQTHTLQAALAIWDRFYKHQIKHGSKQPTCVITILDNGLYGGHGKDNNITISVPFNADLSIVAADGVQPTIRPFGKLIISAKSETNSKVSQSRRFELNGVHLHGQLEIAAENLSQPLHVQINHSTLISDGLVVNADNVHSASELQLTVLNSIVGAVDLGLGVDKLHISDCILDQKQGFALDGRQSEINAMQVEIERVTGYGRIHLPTISHIHDSLFTSPIEIQHKNQGVIRFSYVPQEDYTSNQPTHINCPDPNLIKPRFTATTYGQPGYGQLALTCPPEISGGASNGSEMGAFFQLNQPQRAANIPAILDEYLPFGLEAGLFYVS